jgi:hypothetical protein
VVYPGPGSGAGCRAPAAYTPTAAHGRNPSPTAAGVKPGVNEPRGPRGTRESAEGCDPSQCLGQASGRESGRAGGIVGHWATAGSRCPVRPGMPLGRFWAVQPPTGL